jgi:hypothetical protein
MAEDCCLDNITSPDGTIGVTIADSGFELTVLPLSLAQAFVENPAALTILGTGLSGDTFDQMRIGTNLTTAAPNSLTVGQRVNSPVGDESCINVGYAAAGATLSSNRRIQLDGVTGNINLTGAVNAAFVFPGFGEYAIAEGPMVENRFVRFVGAHGVRLCEPGEEPDGISRKELAVSSGGGMKEEEGPWLLDEKGNRTSESNPNYDPAHADPNRMGVELIGRWFVELEPGSDVEVGDYLTAGVEGRGVYSAERTCFRVLSLRGLQSGAVQAMVVCR